jgi:hypothetical protein
VLGSLIGGILTGGLGAALIGGAAGAATVDQIDRARFTRALDDVYEHASIENRGEFRSYNLYCILASLDSKENNSNHNLS